MKQLVLGAAIGALTTVLLLGAATVYAARTRTFGGVIHGMTVPIGKG